MTDIIGGSIPQEVANSSVLFDGDVQRIPAFVEEAFLQACFLAFDELDGVEDSIHVPKFLSAVAAAIGQDQQAHTAENLGYNPNWRSHFRERASDPITYTPRR